MLSGCGKSRFTALRWSRVWLVMPHGVHLMPFCHQQSGWLRSSRFLPSFLKIERVHFSGLRSSATSDPSSSLSQLPLRMLPGGLLIRYLFLRFLTLEHFTNTFWTSLFAQYFWGISVPLFEMAIATHLEQDEDCY